MVSDGKSPGLQTVRISLFRALRGLTLCFGGRRDVPPNLLAKPSARKVATRAHLARLETTLPRGLLFLERSRVRFSETVQRTGASLPINPTALFRKTLTASKATRTPARFH